MQTSLSLLAQSLNTAFFTMLESVVIQLPQIVTALFVFIVGFGIASLVYYASQSMLRILQIDALVQKTPLNHIVQLFGAKKTLSDIVSFLAFWLVLFFTLIFIADIIELARVSALLKVVALYIPKLVLALLFLVASLLLARFTETLITRTIGNTQHHFAVIVGKTVYVLIVILIAPTIVGILGIDVTFITTNMSIVIASVLVGSITAVVLNTRPLLSNWLACQQLRNILTVGNTIAIGKHSGVLRGFTSTGVIIHEQGVNTVVPAVEFFTQYYSVKAEDVHKK